MTHPESHIQWNQTYVVLIDALRYGDLNVAAVTSHIIKPEDLPGAYDGLLNHKDGYLGTVVDWRTES